MKSLRARTLGPVALLFAPLACEGDPPPAEPAGPSLVELDAWERVAEVDEDVFGAERPADLVCDVVLGIGTETFGGDVVLEINTDSCNYATVRQPSTQALVAGDAVAIRVWHYALTTPAPAQAHLALAIDGRVAWEQYVPTPAAEGFVEGQVAIDRDLPAGTALQFHVHNHGANTYDLVSLEVVRADAGRSASR
jgi:hypothetical protein